MEPRPTIVMLDPATDDILSVCAGPAEDGRCPAADAPPYVCQGLHLVGGRGTGELSSTVETMIAGRCPLTAIADPIGVTSARFTRR